MIEENQVMAVRQPRYNKEEFAQRGDLIYQTQIRPQVEADNHGKIVAIDIETGDFEIANSPILGVHILDTPCRFSPPQSPLPRGEV